MAQQSTYGTVPTSDRGESSLSHQDGASSDFKERRHEVGEMIESKRAHVVILILTSLDILLVVCQIAATLLGLDDNAEADEILEILAHASLAIVTFFVLEVLLKIFSFGPRYFWTSTPHGLLHLADAFIVFVSFFLEVFLKGAEQELGSLLIIFRLWRVIKLTGTIAIETAEHNEARVNELQGRITELEQQLKESQEEVQRLRAHTADQV